MTVARLCSCGQVLLEVAERLVCPGCRLSHLRATAKWEWARNGKVCVMAGRPRKPTALKLLQGNPGKRALPKHEPKPVVGCEPPPWVPVPARAQWKRLAPRLVELGILTEVDGEAFATLCMLTAQLALVSTTPPAVWGSAVVDLSKELRQLWGRFGMTPADRSKISVPPPKSVNPLEEYLGAQG